MLKKALLLLSAASVILSAASGCSSSNDISAVDNADLAASDIYAPYVPREENCHDLSADGAIHVSYPIDSGKDVILLQALGTNSTKITAVNNSGTAVAVYLYYDGKPDDPIQQFTLNNKETKAFTNLTSRFVYSIGVSADADTRLNLTLTD